MMPPRKCLLQYRRTLYVRTPWQGCQVFRSRKLYRQTSLKCSKIQGSSKQQSCSPKQTAIMTTKEEEERVLQKEQWRVEASAVIDDIKPHVTDAALSNLDGSDKNVYINIETKEGRKVTVEMSAQGFAIVDNCYNSCGNPDGQWFETPYALLNIISPGYRTAFGEELIHKLLQVQEEQYLSSLD